MLTSFSFISVPIFSIVLKRPHIFFENESESKLKDWLLRYYKCAKILLDDKNPIHVQNFVGSIINKKDRNGITPMHLASTDWPQSIIKSLLQYGADVNAQDKDGDTPLECTLLRKSSMELDVMKVIAFHQHNSNM